MLHATEHPPSLRARARAALRVIALLAILAAVAVDLVGRWFPGEQVVPAAPTRLAANVVERLNESLRDGWSQLGIEPALPASDLTIARRLSLALVGTIPSLEELRLFEGRPPAERLGWWRSLLLDDDRFYDYFAERLARSYVGSGFEPFVVFRQDVFLSWLSEQLRANRPYNDLVADMISAAGIWTDTPAVNFLTVTSNPEANQGPDKNVLAERIARNILAVNLDCAECHDHPFAPWKQRDFERLAAYFAPVVHDPLGGIVDRPRKNGEDEPQLEPGVPFATELLHQTGAPRERLAAWVTHRDNRAFARATVNRIWALLFGQPLIEPLDDIPLDASLPPAMTVLTDEFVQSGFDLRRLIRSIVDSEAFCHASRHQSPNEKQASAWAVFPVTRLRPEQIARSLVQVGSLETVDRRVSYRGLRGAFDNAFPPADVTRFVTRFGDAGEKELADESNTISQRLLMLNGDLVDASVRSTFSSASGRIALQAPDDATAIETAYLVVLSRRPSRDESRHFAERLHGANGDKRRRAVEDLFWTLANSTEFSWNH